MVHCVSVSGGDRSALSAGGLGAGGGGRTVSVRGCHREEDGQRLVSRLLRGHHNTTTSDDVRALCGRQVLQI